MPVCEKRVQGTLMSYPCILDAGHERIGPADDPEPCMTAEVERSVRVHQNWEVRQQERERDNSGTIEEIEAEVAETMAQAEVAEPEHDLDAADCMMRPANADAGNADVHCPTCRPAVLVANAEAIRAGEIHNPYDTACTRRSIGDHSLPTERCYICRPDKFNDMVDRMNAESYPDHVEPPVAGEPSDREAEIDRNARAYGFEVGKDPAHRVVPVIEETSPDNPFVDSNWREGLEVHSASLLAEEPDPAVGVHPVAVEPTKQRDGDQVLPKKGDRVVQDWMIDREMNKMEPGDTGAGILDPDAEMVIEAMEESQRVGIERYGQALHTFDGRLNIRDLAEELRDAFVYVSKMQMTAEADKATLARMVEQALDTYMADESDPSEMFNSTRVAEIAVDRILDWVLIQKIGPEQVVPVKVSDDEEWMGT